MRTPRFETGSPFALRVAFVLCAVAGFASCNGHGERVPDARNDAGSALDAADFVRSPEAMSDEPPTVAEAGPRTPVAAETVSSRVDTMQLLFAAGEMQTSGAPFVRDFTNRDLADYNRFFLPPDQYIVPSNAGTAFFVTRTDPFGFSSAIESYEYSKDHMNMVAQQTGAGVSLANGPLIQRQPGSTPFQKLQGRVEHLLAAAGTDAAGWAVLPPPAPTSPSQATLGGSPNDFGFPGLWPTFAPYASFDATMSADASIVRATTCTSAIGFGGLGVFAGNAIDLYECNYGSLRLTDRVAQTEQVIGPGIQGFAAWKEALSAVDFVGPLHDGNADPVTMVAAADAPQIGRPRNEIQALDPGASTGVFIGSTPLEGMWGLTMIDEIDNAAAWLLSAWATADGATLVGFPSVLAATEYDYPSPLVWFPTRIAATEDGQGAYPGVSSLRVADATSHSVDLAALAQGYSLMFAMTDARNHDVGQLQGLTAAFDGDPFAADDGAADGEDSPHDRALAVMRVAFVDLDRMHTDPGTGVVVDTATVNGDTVSRGSTVTTTALGHVVVGLRHELMACNATVTPYGAPNADPSGDASGILNEVPMHPTAPGAASTFSPRVRQVLLTQAAFVFQSLTRGDGTVANGATLAGGTWVADASPASLESQGAALRVLTEAYLLTHDVTYQGRAQAVARTLLGPAFWSDPAQMFRGAANGPDDVQMTPERFAWLQQALREMYEVLWVPGDPLLDRSNLEIRIARANKLLLNGWDDLNGNQAVDKPTECLGGRLQMAEQPLSGELGAANEGYPGSTGGDRDSDCVPNITVAGVGSLLAGQVHFHAP